MHLDWLIVAKTWLSTLGNQGEISSFWDFTLRKKKKKHFVVFTHPDNAYFRRKFQIENQHDYNAS